jgi:hypothetical protein
MNEVLAAHADALAGNIQGKLHPGSQVNGNSADDTETHADPAVNLRSVCLTLQCRKLRCRLPVKIATTARLALCLLRSSVCHTWSALPMSCSSLCLHAAVVVAPALQTSVKLSHCCFLCDGLGVLAHGSGKVQ